MRECTRECTGATTCILHVCIRALRGSGLDPFHEHQPFALGEVAHRLEAVGLKRGRRRRTAGRPGRASTSAARPPRAAAPTTMTRPPGRRTRSVSRTAATAVLGPHRGQQAAGVVDDGEVERVVVEPRRVGGATFDVDEDAGLRPRPSRARAAEASSGTTATARPDRPTLPATAARRPPWAQPICTRRSPIFTPVMPTTSRYGLSRRLERVRCSAC